MKNCVVGSFATGKTSVVKNFSKLFLNLERMVLDNIYPGKRFDELDSKQVVIYQRNILNAQMTLEKTIKCDQFYDNGLLTILAYSYFAFDDEEYEHFYNIVKNFLSKQPYDNVFYLPIEFQIKDDGQRHIDQEFQKRIQKQLLSIMESMDVEYVKITGSVEERVAKISDIIS